MTPYALLTANENQIPPTADVKVIYGIFGIVRLIAGLFHLGIHVYVFAFCNRKRPFVALMCVKFEIQLLANYCLVC